MRRLFVGLMVVLAAGGPAVGQQPARDRVPDRTLPYDTTELFRGLLHFHGIKPVQLDEVRSFPRRNLIVIVLEPEGLAANRGYLSSEVQAVLQAGGSVLIASDARQSLASFHPDQAPLSITGEHVQARSERIPRFGDLNRPFVRSQSLASLEAIGIRTGQPPPPEVLLFLGRERIATNRPSAVRIGGLVPYFRTRVADFPQGCVTVRGRPLADDEAFAFGGSGSGSELPFRCLVLGDPDVFSNGLIGATDEKGGPATDNLAFANAVVQFLKGPESSPRTHCLFVENGRVQSRFDEVQFAAGSLPVPPLPVPPLTDPEFQRKLTNLVNDRVAAMQDRDSIQRRLAGTARRYRSSMRFLAMAAAVVVVVLFCSRVWRRRHEPDLPPVPTDTGRIAGSAPPGSIARRREELLQTGNYTPLVQDYLRELFGERGLARPHEEGPRPMPAVKVGGSDAKTLKSHITILWNVAYGPANRPVTYSRWKELEPMIESVRRAAEEGRWEFVEGGA